MEKGLYGKYRVFKAEDTEPVDNCFILRPDKDPAARKALIEYANNCGNPELAADLCYWVDCIEGNADRWH